MNNISPKIIYIYIDESGVLHKNATDDFFLFAGISFFSENMRSKARRNFSGEETRIKNKNNLWGTELKGSNLQPKHKHKLYKAIKEFDTFVVETNINNIKNNTDKKELQRFKNYMIVRIIKNVLLNLIGCEQIDSSDLIDLRITIDQQNVANDGYYSDLGESIHKELFEGKYDSNMKKREPVFEELGKVIVKHADSEHDIYIRMADVIANKKFSHLRRGEAMKLRENHTHLKLP